MQKEWKTSDFFYSLPQSLIAQTPAQPRDSSRLLMLNRETGAILHRHFSDILAFLNAGDCLILNDSRVLPARLYGKKEGTGTQVEFLLLSPKGGDVWEVLTGPGRRAKPGTRFSFGDGVLFAEVLSIADDGNRLVKFSYTGNFYTMIDRIGEMPLPHYIKQQYPDQERYQTVYAKERGSAAAPTAGLHFTPELLEKAREKGVAIAFVTLHIGLGTFRPVSVKSIAEHKMHAEHYYLSAENAQIIENTKQNGGRVIAVGTTACRTVESVAARNQGTLRESSGWTDIFIYPGSSFRVLDGLITNFHLPESTLIMLVSAFAGYENTMHAYQIAVKEQYRFFSFGDAMLIL